MKTKKLIYFKIDNDNIIIKINNLKAKDYSLNKHLKKNY